MQIPDDPRYYEKFFFTPGDLGFKTFGTEKARLGTLICWDQWFPEAARLTALQGADIGERGGARPAVAGVLGESAFEHRVNGF
jgi:predicted amidohydrolase